MTQPLVPPEIYPMPSFPILLVQDIEASARWYQEALGFQHVFAIPGHGGAPMVVHLRWIKYADVLLRRAMGPPLDDHPKGVGISLSFAVFDGDVDELAARARAYGASLESEPKNQPWNVRDFSIRDPDGFLLTFTQGPLDPTLTMDRIVTRTLTQGRHDSAERGLTRREAV